MMATVTLSPADKETDRHAWAMMQRAKPTVDWDKATLRRADLTGEGERSRVMVGRDDELQLFVAVTRPGREGPTNPQVFALGRPESLSLAFYKLERPDDCLAEDGTPLEGCRPRKGKSGLLLTVDGVKQTRIYWVGAEKRFATWPRAE